MNISVLLKWYLWKQERLSNWSPDIFGRRVGWRGEVNSFWAFQKRKGCSVLGLEGFLCLAISSKKWRLMGCLLMAILSSQSLMGWSPWGQKGSQTNHSFPDNWVPFSDVVIGNVGFFFVMSLPSSRFNEQIKKLELYSQIPNRN